MEGVAESVLEGIRADLWLPVLVAVIHPFPRVAAGAKPFIDCWCRHVPVTFHATIVLSVLDSLDREN